MAVAAISVAHQPGTKKQGVVGHEQGTKNQDQWLLLGEKCELCVYIH